MQESMRHQTTQMDDDYLELTHLTAGEYSSFFLLSLFPWCSDHEVRFLQGYSSMAMRMSMHERRTARLRYILHASRIGSKSHNIFPIVATKKVR
jgi:hypothetical protein